MTITVRGGPRGAIDLVPRPRMPACYREAPPLETVERGPQGAKGDRGEQGERGPPALPISYPIQVAPGPFALPLSPPSAAPETIVLTVNHFAYRAPDSFSYDRGTAVLTWAGGFDFVATDDVSVSYF